MIYDFLSAPRPYSQLSPRFAAAFDFLGRARGGWPAGRTDIIPGEVWAIVVQKTASPPAQAKFEYHRRFADVHYVIAGRDEFAWTDRLSDLTPLSPFNPENDFGLLDGTPSQFLPLHDDRFVVMFPNEAHAPHIGDGEITRICVKVLMDPVAASSNP